MLRRSILCLIIIFNIPSIASADIKEKIIDNLNNIETLKFSFTQTTNDVSENGNCILKFPKKLKCNYKSKNMKILIINNNRLIITQKRYDKTKIYPLSKSMFINILDKKSLIMIINQSIIEEEKNNLVFTTFYEKNNISILFDKNKLELKGWKTQDSYNNKISFLLDILETNQKLNKSEFTIPITN